jgi:ABC-type dipeptide/oligopeptide/nickel transport system ATPase subunit
VALQVAACVFGGALFAWLPFQDWVKSAESVTKPSAPLPSGWNQALGRAELPDATVLANVMIGMYRLQKTSLVAQMFGLPSSRAETRRFRDDAFALLERFGMTRYADYPAGHLSYGDQRRVEMMRALALQPDVLLLDLAKEDAGAIDVGDDEDDFETIFGERQAMRQAAQ